VLHRDLPASRVAGREHPVPEGERLLHRHPMQPEHRSQWNMPKRGLILVFLPPPTPCRLLNVLHIPRHVNALLASLLHGRTIQTPTLQTSTRTRRFPMSTTSLSALCATTGPTRASSTDAQALGASSSRAQMCRAMYRQQGTILTPSIPPSASTPATTDPSPAWLLVSFSKGALACRPSCMPKQTMGKRRA